MLLAGGGIKGGQVIGQSDKHAANASSARYTPPNLMATLLHTLLDPAQVRLASGLGRVANVVTDGDPIPGLL